MGTCRPRPWLLRHGITFVAASSWPIRRGRSIMVTLGRGGDRSCQDCGLQSESVAATPSPGWRPARSTLTLGRRPSRPTTRFSRGGQVPPGPAGHRRLRSSTTAGGPGAPVGCVLVHNGSYAAIQPTTSAVATSRGRPRDRPAVLAAERPRCWHRHPWPTPSAAGVGEVDGPRGFFRGGELYGRCVASSAAANSRLPVTLAATAPPSFRPRGRGRPAASFTAATRRSRAGRPRGLFYGKGRKCHVSSAATAHVLARGGGPLRQLFPAASFTAVALSDTGGHLASARPSPRPRRRRPLSRPPSRPRDHVIRGPQLAAAPPRQPRV